MSCQLNDIACTEENTIFGGKIANPQFKGRTLPLLTFGRSVGLSACIFANKGAAGRAALCPPGRSPPPPPPPPPTRNRRPRPRPSVSSTGVQFWWRPQWEREIPQTFAAARATLQIPRAQCSRQHRHIQFSFRLSLSERGKSGGGNDTG